MVIRDYTEKDKAAVVNFLEMQLDELYPCDPFKRKAKPGYGEFSINNLLEQNKEKGKVLIAEENGKVIGYASGWVKYIEEFEEQTGGPEVNGMFDNLFVKPEYRNKGVAKALIKELEKYFKENNCGLVWLNVFSENIKALALYSNLGYTPNSTTMIKNIYQN